MRKSNLCYTTSTGLWPRSYSSFNLTYTNDIIKFKFGGYTLKIQNIATILNQARIQGGAIGAVPPTPVKVPPLELKAFTLFKS